MAKDKKEKLMRKWNASNDLDILNRAFQAIREFGLIEPGSVSADDPVDLRGMSFPTVTLCKELELPTVVVNRIAGRQEFQDATIRRVNFSKARLNFSVWNDCHFDHVNFDGARLDSVRFFGCRFDACSFHSVELKDASFSVGRNGRETEINNTVFVKADFRGASCHNPVLRSTSFIDCKMDGFVFDGPLFDAVEIAGTYSELTVRGVHGEPARNRLRADLSKARLTWLNADYGVDLTAAILPADRSCLVITNRLCAVNRLCDRLPLKLGETGDRVARVIEALFGNRAMSPLKPSQTTFLLSRGMIADFAETNDEDVVESVFTRIRLIAEQDGFLAANA
jgi:uncharacterized protein YjbI with pentapeptide repeats